MNAPIKISLRVYPVGFGDCFLLGFHYPRNDDRFVLIDFGSTELTRKRSPRSAKFNAYMRKVADDIAERSGRRNGKGGQLHALIATHRHADHINGFATKTKPTAADTSGDVIRSLKPRFVLQPWTEHPDLAPKALAPPQASSVDGPRGFTSLLAGMQAAAEGIVAEVDRLDPRTVLPPGTGESAGDTPLEPQVAVRSERLDFVGLIRFLGQDNIANRSAVENLIAMGRRKGAKPLYLNAGARPALALPGVKTHVLGPPTLKQSDGIRTMRSADDTEFWMLLGATGTRFTAARGKPFSGGSWVSGQQVPDYARWMRQHVRSARAETLLGIVRALDKQMNNTSLILVFEVGKARLLFPGDAQLENWQYALGFAKYRKLLAGTTLYKVGHHGSRNATPKQALWEKFIKRSKKDSPNRMWSIVSTMAGKHGTTEATRVPRRTLVEALDRETNFRTTQDFKRVEPDWRDFEIDPKTGRVTELPKAGRSRKSARTGR